MASEIRIGDARLLTGDCMEGMATLPDASVQTCITSPPYWALRDYGTAKWVGGESGCDHQPPDDRGGTTIQPMGNGRHPSRFGGPACHKCGAERKDQQIGLEEGFDEYLAKIVAVFREVRRVLRGDGTVWLNLGDSYAGNTGGSQGKNGQCADRSAAIAGVRDRRWAKTGNGLKAKDMVGAPWRVAFALQADGWYLRQDIIWHKPNPMPESVRDRCTKAHEYIFLLSKKAQYYFDQAGIQEARIYDYNKPVGSWAEGPGDHSSIGHNQPIAGSQTKCTYKSGNKKRKPRPGSPANNHGAQASSIPWEGNTRNKRSVWTVASKPYAGAHFATFPPALIGPCVLAGCPAGGTVLDPFSGTGTTGLVALQQGRKYVGIEMNPEYQELAKDRLAAVAGQQRLFA